MNICIRDHGPEVDAMRVSGSFHDCEMPRHLRLHMKSVIASNPAIVLAFVLVY